MNTTAENLQFERRTLFKMAELYLDTTLTLESQLFGHRGVSHPLISKARESR
jgi:hypothetical protein